MQGRRAMKEEKPSGSTSNTEDCFRTFVGKKLIGYFRKGGDSYLVFSDKRALVFHHETGAYWVATADDVGREVDIIAQELQELKKSVAALALTGLQP